VTKNTINQPNPVLKENIQNNGTYVHGTVSVTANRSFTLEGYAQTSHGKVVTRVAQNINFFNLQKYNVATDGSVYDQKIKQTTSVSSSTTTQQKATIVSSYKWYDWPLNLSYAFTANPDGSFQQTTSLKQSFYDGELTNQNGISIYFSTLLDAVAPTDTLMVDASGNVTTQGQANSEKYVYMDSNGGCWNEKIEAANGVLTSANGGSCAH
jgi:hypothetical protein